MVMSRPRVLVNEFPGVRPRSSGDRASPSGGVCAGSNPAEGTSDPAVGAVGASAGIGPPCGLLPADPIARCVDRRRDRPGRSRRARDLLAPRSTRRVRTGRSPTPARRSRRTTPSGPSRSWPGPRSTAPTTSRATDHRAGGVRSPCRLRCGGRCPRGPPRPRRPRWPPPRGCRRSRRTASGTARPTGQPWRARWDRQRWREAARAAPPAIRWSRHRRRRTTRRSSGGGRDAASGPRSSSPTPC